MSSTDLTAKADVGTRLLDLFELTSMQQLIDIGDVEMLTDIIPKGFLSLLYAGGGVGKSTIVATQIKQILTQRDDQEVLLLDFDQAIVRNRNTLMELVDLPHFGNVAISTKPQADGIMKILKERVSLEDVVIVVDALQGMFDRFNLDINKATDAGAMMDVLKAFRDKGATVIVVHHSNKIDIATGTAAFRGSAVIKDSVDNLYEVIGVERDSEYLTLKVCMEHKYSFLIDNPNPIYKIDRKLNYVTVDESSIKVEVKLPRGVSQTQIEEAVSIISEHSGKATLAIETIIKEYLGRSITKAKEVVKYLKEVERIQATKIKSDGNKYTLEVL